MLAVLGERSLNTHRGLLAPIVRVKMSELSEVCGERTIIGASACGDEELQANRETQDELVRFEESFPAVDDSAAAVPSTRVS